MDNYIERGVANMLRNLFHRVYIVLYVMAFASLVNWYDFIAIWRVWNSYSNLKFFRKLSKMDPMKSPSPTVRFYSRLVGMEYEEMREVNYHLLLLLLKLYSVFSAINHLITGGSAKMLMFLCLSPTSQYLGESLRVLGFGTRARQVQRSMSVKKIATWLIQNKQAVLKLCIKRRGYIQWRGNPTSHCSLSK